MPLATHQAGGLAFGTISYLASDPAFSATGLNIDSPRVAVPEAAAVGGEPQTEFGLPIEQSNTKSTFFEEDGKLFEVDSTGQMFYHFYDEFGPAFTEFYPKGEPATLDPARRFFDLFAGFTGVENIRSMNWVSATHNGDGTVTWENGQGWKTTVGEDGLILKHRAPSSVTESKPSSHSADGAQVNQTSNAYPQIEHTVISNIIGSEEGSYTLDYSRNWPRTAYPLPFSYCQPAGPFIITIDGNALINSCH